jgi:hypothetical protein
MQHTDYVKVSIFYSQKNWFSLSSNCIIPLQYKLRTLGCCEDFVTLVSFEKGQSLRLIILVDSANKEYVRSLCKSFIKGWLKRNPSDYNGPTNNLGSQLWMNFNNNSIHFDLFHVPFALADKKTSFLSMYKAASAQVLSFMSETNDFDVEEKMTTVIFLYMAAFSRIPQDLALVCISELLKLNQQELDVNGIENVQSITLANVAEDFLHSRESLLEFYNTVDSNDDPTLIDWVTYCENSINIFDDAESRGSYLVALLKTINLCFGMGVLEENYLFLFIERFMLSLA